MLLGIFKLKMDFSNESTYKWRANWKFISAMAFIKNLTSAQIIVRGNKMKQKHLLPIYSFINTLTNICYTTPKASGSVRDCIS